MERPDLETWALDLADHMARRSKDPGRKVGAVILRPDNTIASAGYNGFPRLVSDDPALYADKPTKLRRTVHAELNAILTAREPLHGYTIYVSPLHPCSQCAAAIIQAGITKVVARIGSDGGAGWVDSFAEAAEMFGEAGIDVKTVETGGPLADGTSRPATGVGLFRPRGWPIGL
jgi:dCMP deaminase